MTVVAVAPFLRRYDLPWTAAADERDRLRRIFAIVLGTALVLSLTVPLLPVPERRTVEYQELPQRLAGLLLERKAPPRPPPPPPEVAEAVTEAVPTVETALPAVEPLERKTQVVPSLPDPRERASTAGLLPMQDQLAALRDNVAVQKAVEARNLSGRVGEQTRAERSLVTSRVGVGSGGIDTSTLSRGYGGGVGSLDGHATTHVAGYSGGDPGSGQAADDRSPGGSKPARSREEIELVFDRNKSAIYALYSRALRSNPALQGKLVLELTIAPSGEVIDCRVVSSELGDPELERKLVTRVRMFRFEERDVEMVTTTKPIDFFPA